LNSRVAILSFLLFTSSAIYAQPGLYPMGAAAVGMGNITTLSDDVWTAFTNPAGLGIAPAFAVGVQHEQRYSLPDFGIDAFAAVLPVWDGGIGLTVANLGFSEQGESRFGIQIGRKLGTNIAAGVGFHTHILRYPSEYSNAFALSADAGIYANLFPRLTTGVYVSNVSFARFNNEARDRLPIIFHWGVGYETTSTIMLYAELEKDVNAPLRAKIGTSCYLFDVLYLRMGVLSQPFEIHYGLGYVFRIFQMDFALYRHPVLGFSPQLSLSIALK